MSLYKLSTFRKTYGMRSSTFKTFLLHISGIRLIMPMTFGFWEGRSLNLTMESPQIREESQ